MPPADDKFSDVRSLHHRLQLLWCIRSDICYAFNILSQIINVNFSLQNIKDVNKTVGNVKGTKMQVLNYVELEKCTISIVDYSKYSFSYKKDNTSMLGYLL